MKLTFEKLSFKPGKYQATFLVLSLVGLLLWQFPISLLSSQVAKLTQCRVILHQASGTVWQGSSGFGFAQQISGSSQCTPPTAVTERIHWSTLCHLVDLNCQMTVSHPSFQKPLQVTARSDRIEFSPHQMKLSANLLEGFGTPWNTLRPQGDLEIFWNGLQFSKQSEGMISIKITNLVSPISPVKPLGSYELKLNLQSDPLVTTNASNITNTSNTSNTSNMLMQLITLQGPLILNGKGQLGLNKVNFEGDASADPEARNSLIGVLSIIGIKNGDHYQLKF